MKIFINEFVKDYKKKTTWLYFIIIAGLLAIVNFASTYNAKPEEYPKVKTLLTDSIGLSSSLAAIFILIVFANNLSQEYSRGTVKFLYSKPKSRSKILTAKIFLAIFNYIVFTIFAFVTDIAMKKFVFYKNHINLHALKNEKLGEEFFNRTLLEQIGIVFSTQFLVTLFFISLVLIICVIFKTQILSLIIVMFMVLGNGIITLITTLLVNKLPFVKYVFTNINLLPTYYTSETSRKIVEEGFKLNGTALLLMVLCYSVAFTLISYIVNARRDITLS